MTATGVLATLVALVIYPGGLATVGVAAAGFRLGGDRSSGGDPWSSGARVAAAAALIAASLAPLPGSPARSVPDGAGAGPNLLGVLLLLAVGAGALPTIVERSRWWGAAGAGVVAALLTLAARAGSLSLTEGLIGLDEPAYAAARVLTCVALLAVGVRIAARPRTGDGFARALLLAAAGLTVFSMLLSGVAARVARAFGASSAAAVLTMGALIFLLTTAYVAAALRGSAAGRGRFFAGGAVVASAAAVAATLVASR